METLRFEHVHNTKIILTNRTEFWPFQLIKEIKAVFDQPDYPNIHPNTVKPEYSAAQHAKYAVLAETVCKKVFDTPYYAWLDVGYFRDIVQRKEFFKMDIPPGVDPKRVSFNHIRNQHMTTKPFKIFRNNMLWVGGGMFLGRGEVILKLEQLYHSAVLYFLEKKLMNTNQQVLYSIYSNEGRKALNPRVELQLFDPKGPGAEILGFIWGICVESSCL